MTTVWMSGYTFINRAVDECQIRATVVNNRERSHGWSSSCLCFSNFGRIYSTTSCRHLPLPSSGLLGMFIVGIGVGAGFLSSDFSWEINLRIRADGLTMSVYPRPPRVARVVVILQRGVSMTVSRDVLKKSNLEKQSSALPWTSQHSRTNHGFILLRFREFTIEDLVAGVFQKLVHNDLSNDVFDSLIRRL
jgi:hypothetical protein